MRLELNIECRDVIYIKNLDSFVYDSKEKSLFLYFSKKEDRDSANEEVLKSIIPVRTKINEYEDSSYEKYELIIFENEYNLVFLIKS